MSRKSNILKYRSVTNGDMSTASITSTVTNIQFLDNVGIQINFTGSPTGTFEVQISADHEQDDNGNVGVVGSWTPIAFSAAVTTASGSPIYLDINQISAPWIRVVYTKTSGTGVLNVYLTAKTV